MPYLYIFVGLLLLMVGGHYLVVSSVGIALKYRVSTLVIGLTLVSFATSAPELLVSMTAAMKGNPDIAMGNVFGSNIANTGLILGFTALFFVLPVNRKNYIKDWIFLMFVTVLLFFVGYTGDTIQWYEGAILVALLIYYNVVKIRKSRNVNLKELESEIDTSGEKKPMWQLISFLVIGIIGLKFGADLLVMGAKDVAMTYGISERVVSLSMVALGTSLPELVASIMAARKGEKDLAIGNIIGSNLFNILGVLGFTSLIHRITPSPEIWTFDYWWVLGFTFMLYPLISVFNRSELGRREGGFLFTAYVFYIVIIFLKN